MTDTERIEQAVEAIRIFSVAPYLVLTLIYLSLVVGPVSLLPFAVYILNACFTVGRIRVDFTNISVVFHVDGLEIKTWIQETWYTMCTSNSFPKHCMELCCNFTVKIGGVLWPVYIYCRFTRCTNCLCTYTTYTVEYTKSLREKGRIVTQWSLFLSYG